MKGSLSWTLGLGGGLTFISCVDEMILINLVAVLLCWTPPTVRHCLRLFIFPLCRMANLSYIRNFCFSHSSKDELSYCLSTFEAAVEYINLGKLHDSPAVGLAHTHGCTYTHTDLFLTLSPPRCPRRVRLSWATRPCSGRRCTSWVRVPPHPSYTFSRSALILFFVVHCSDLNLKMHCREWTEQRLFVV